MKRILSVILTLTLILSIVSFQTVSVGAAETEGFLFDENFENQADGTVILSQTENQKESSGDFVYDITSSDGKWSVKRVGDSRGELKVVKADSTIDPDGTYGNVLKYTNTQSFWYATAKVENANNRGKMLIYEYDFYRTDAGETELPSYFDGTTQTHEPSRMAITTPTWGYQLNLGTGVSMGTNTLEQKYEAYAQTLNMANSGNGGDGGTYGIVDPGKWHKVKVIVDTSETPTTSRPDTYRMYIDGELVYGYYCYGETGRADQTKKVYDFSTRFYTSNENGIENYSVNDIQGLHFGYSYSNNTGSMYFDNMKVYTADKFKLISAEEPTSFDAESETLDYTFSNAIPTASIAKIKVKDAAGAEIAGAVNASDSTISADGKTLSLKLNGSVLALNTDYNVVFPVEFTDVNGQGLVTYYSALKHKTGMPAEDLTVAESPEALYSFKTARAASGKNILLNENFETNYTAGTKIFEFNGNNETLTQESTDGKWKASKYGGASGALEVVSAGEITTGSDGRTGNVLKYTSSRASYGVFAKVENANNRGRMLIYEYDVYIDGDNLMLPSYTDETGTYYTQNAKFPIIKYAWGNQAKMGTGIGIDGANKLEQKYEAYTSTLNESNSGIAGDQSTYGILEKNKWHTVKVIVDTSEAATASRPDTYRAYIDGELVYGYYCYGESGRADQSKKVYDFAQQYYTSNANGVSNYAVGNMTGLHFNAGYGNATTMYLDNMKVYTLGEKFKVESATETDSFNPSGDTLNYAFTTPVKKGAEAYVYVAAADGTKIENAIKRAELSEDSHELTLTLNKNIIKQNTAYSVVFPVEFTDEDGQGLVTYYSSFKHKEGMPAVALGVPESEKELKAFATPKSYKLYSKSVSAYTYDAAAEKVSASFKLQNITDGELPSWCVLAVYSGGKLIGAGQISKNVGGNVTTDAITVDVTDITSEEAASITAVKLFVWNGFDAMEAYHTAEILSVS